METLPKSIQLLLLTLSLCLSVSCAEPENLSKQDEPPPEAKGIEDIAECYPLCGAVSTNPAGDLSKQDHFQEEQSRADTKNVNPKVRFKTPPKPPIPRGADVAIDCGPIAARYEEHWDFLRTRGWCGYLNADGTLQIDPEVTALLDFTQPAPGFSRHSKDLKCLSIYLSNKQGGFAYIRQDGRARFAPFPYDNECQPFGNGVFIQYINGLAVYTDENFEPVKETNYVLADGFYNHLSKVCRVKPEKKYDSYGEHFEWIGGQCGYLGTEFQVVEPVIHAYENTPRPTGGKYDGDDPTGRDARMVEALRADLPNGKTLEAVFLKGGCNFRSRHATNPSECGEKFPNLPKALYTEGHSIREIHLRQEDQTYYRGLVVSNGAPGFKEWEREIYWHSVEPMKAPVQD